MGSILYECTVSNCYALNVRGGPSMSFQPIAWLQRGDVVRVDGMVNGWYKLEGAEKYCYKDYLTVTRDLTANNQATPTPAPVNPTPQLEPAAIPVENSGSTVGGQPRPTSPVSNTQSMQSTPSMNTTGESGYKWVNISVSRTVDSPNRYVPEDKNTEPAQKPSGKFYLHMKSTYPTKISGSNKYPEYNWEMSHTLNYGKSSSLFDIFKVIRRNLNMPNIYSPNELNSRVHLNFNRFRMEFPDLYMKNTTAVVIFTRPDLNLFDSNGTKTQMVGAHPRTNFIVSNHPRLSQLLTARGNLEEHMFNPLLSNLAQSLDIQDDRVDTLEVGRTYTGYKMQYSKHNIESITSGTISIKFKETFDLAITNIHQLWVDYQSNVYSGLFEPKRQYIYEKILDYACDIYYFLLDHDGETIRFWSKYYGCFPNNVPKSWASFELGSPVQFPELNVTYSYIYKEDLSPAALQEFNINSGIGPGESYEYMVPYLSGSGMYGDTWVGAPFVRSYTYTNGVDNTVLQGFKLVWKKGRGD